MPVIKPTVGRIVWFYRYDAATDSHRGPYAATVAYVHSDSVVNLCVTEHDGGHTARTSVPLVQEGAVMPKEDCCGWMPYQLGQAKKTEEVLSDALLASEAKETRRDARDEKAAIEDPNSKDDEGDPRSKRVAKAAETGFRS